MLYMFCGTQITDSWHAHMSWKTVSIPGDMLDQINTIVDKDPNYTSASEFIRAAVREAFRRHRLDTETPLRELEAIQDN